MTIAVSPERMALDQDDRIAAVIERERPRLRNFLRRRLSDPSDVEDVLQDVFSELVEANRLLMPIDHVAGWLFRVARNRVTDLFRKSRADRFSELERDDGSDPALRFEELLPSSEDGPEALFARAALLDELESALAELPPEQRFVFLAHELEGRSFREIAAATGVAVNTLLSRKRYAVLRLRERLQVVYEEFNRR